MKFGLVCVLMVLSMEIVLGAPLVNDPYGNDIKRFCGTKLAEVLQFLCEGYYNEPIIMHPFKRKKRGIIDECCNTPCSKNYLKTYYCAPDISKEVTTISSTDIASTLQSDLQHTTYED